MEAVDAAFDAFRKCLPEMEAALADTGTEADARLKIIDRILVEVLGWPYSDIRTEKETGAGFADYVLSIGGRARLVVEAKRDGRTLGCDNKPGGVAYKLNGPVFRTDTAREGIKQACGYCGMQNAELACITNGREWVIFRGNRVGDGSPTLEGMAFVFPSLGLLADKFDLFFSLLGRQNVATLTFRPYFQDVEGQPIRATVFRRALRAPGTQRLLPAGRLSLDLDQAMAAFFQRLSGDDDPEIIQECFVETPESRTADQRLARIAEEIAAQLRPMDTAEALPLRQLIEKNQAAQQGEFVLLVGTKGSGKSTFIKRFFERSLPRYIADRCAVVRVDLKRNSGDRASVATWLDKEVLAAAERVIFPDSPTFNELQGMFFDEYRRLSRGTLSALHENDKVAFQQEFGKHIEKTRQDDKHRYIATLLRHTVNQRKWLPVIVFDNADHFDIDFQQSVYQYARSLFEDAHSLIIMPITDRTSWQLSKFGALQSFEHTSLFLPTPPTGEVIRKRIQFIEDRVERAKRNPQSDYFVRKGVTLTLDDLNMFSRTLERIFIDTQSVSKTIGELSNYDVRRTLDLVRKTVSSPHLDVSGLVTAYVTGDARAIPSYKVDKAIIRLGYDIYPVEQNDFVQNIFALDASVETTPLLGIRLLALLRDVPAREHEGQAIDIDQLRGYMAALDVSHRAIDLWLDALLRTGLILNYDPTVQDIEDARQLEISPAGRRHLHWALGNTEYLSAMMHVTPLLTESTFEKILGLDAREWLSRTAEFISYLLDEDEAYVTIPQHAAYETQRHLRTQLGEARTRMLSRAPRRT